MAISKVEIVTSLLAQTQQLLCQARVASSDTFLLSTVAFYPVFTIVFSKSFIQTNFNLPFFILHSFLFFQWSSQVQSAVGLSYLDAELLWVLVQLAFNAHF